LILIPNPASTGFESDGLLGSGNGFESGSRHYDSFKKYQTHLLKEFDQLSKEFNFLVIDGRKSIPKIQNEIRARIIEHLFARESASAFAEAMIQAVE
jgi:hypothetical protein